MQGATRQAAHASPRSSDGLLLPTLLAFTAIAFEQVLHTPVVVLRIHPYYAALHWLSDSLLALPLAALAVWAGQRIAARRGLGASRADLVARACLICLLFAMLLVPGAALHEQADRLTHVHASLSVHAHAATEATDLASPAGLAGFASHALADGLAGQVAGLPLVAVVLLWQARRRRPDRVVAPKDQATPSRTSAHLPVGWG